MWSHDNNRALVFVLVCIIWNRWPAAASMQQMDSEVCILALQQCGDILRLQEEACNILQEKVSAFMDIVLSLRIICD